MKTILKKNQLMITALAIMIAIAGYLQFTGAKLDKEDYLPASGSAQTDVENFAAGEDELSLEGLLDLSEEDLAKGGLTEIESMDSDVEVIEDDYLQEGMEIAVPSSETATPEDGEIPGEAVFTGTANIAVLAEAKLLKEQVRAKNKETLLEIVNSTTLSDEQKKEAVAAMVEMTAIAEKEMSAEILLEAKGFAGVVVSISESGVDVVVNATQLTDAQRAQIEDIVKRKAEVDAENIIISTVVQ